MKYCLMGHDYIHEIQTVCQVFYPNEKFECVDDALISSEESGGLEVKSELTASGCSAYIYENGQLLSWEKAALPNDSLSGLDDKEKRKIVKRAMYSVLKAHTGFKPPWGSFTGIRPSKIANELWKKGFSYEQTKQFMAFEYDMDEDKIELCCEVAEAEREILKNNNGQDFALYVGIPFCPTRCFYCSFTSTPIDRYKDKVDGYLDCLMAEMEFLRAFAKDRTLESVYVGGGTPTSLNCLQLETLFFNLQTCFDMGAVKEFSVEAGRPDTITREKLAVMKQFGVSRISINPQTMNPDTLEKIGRKHTPLQFLEAFELAREMGFDNINVDLIVGLPGEGAEQVEDTMAQIRRLDPESITVHTLAVKRGSQLKEEMLKSEKSLTQNDFSGRGFSKIEKMIRITKEYAGAMGMKPYYMYRQKNMVGHFENIGYCKEGRACVYNVQIMEEQQTVLAIGAGAVSKTLDRETGRLERIFNVKNVDDYISRTDEMLKRKEKLYENKVNAD